MNVGINIKVCRDSGCRWYEAYECLLRRCPGSEESGWHDIYMGNTCPLPEKCKYKNLHIINKVSVRELKGCPDECKRLAGAG